MLLKLYDPKYMKMHYVYSQSYSHLGREQPELLLSIERAYGFWLSSYTLNYPKHKYPGLITLLSY